MDGWIDTRMDRERDNGDIQEARPRQTVCQSQLTDMNGSTHKSRIGSGYLVPVIKNYLKLNN